MEPMKPIVWALWYAQVSLTAGGVMATRISSRTRRDLEVFGANVARWRKIQEQSSRPVDEDHLGCLFDVVSWVFAFDELAVFEAGLGSDEGDQVWCVHVAAPALGGFYELERHRDAGGFGPGALGDLGAVADGGEGRLDRVRGPQVDPVLGGVVVEREQLLDVIGDLRHGLGELGPVERGEGLHSGPGVVGVLGAPDLGQG